MERQLEWRWGPRHDRRAAKKRPLLTDRHKVEMRTDDPSDSGYYDWILEALKAIARRPRYGLPRIYQMGGLMARVRAAAPGVAARIEVLGEDSLRLLLSQVCDCDEIRRNHKGLDIHRTIAPPRDILQSMLAMDGLDQHRFPPLELLASAPLLGSDGRIISRPGYHRRDQIFLSPTIEIPPVPAKPTQQDVDQALNWIFDFYLGDFPFADDASKCHALATILTPLVRRLVRGPTPLLLALASTPGTGKTLLMAALSQIISGRPAEPTMLRSSEEEMAKTLLSVLLAAPPFVFFDNIDEADSATLAAVIASPDCRFAGRILGATRWVEVPALACWLASGNNPKVSRELARRTVVIKLDANAERPEQRSGFKIKNLLRWGIEHRANLLHAALVLCRAWVAAGRPKGKAVLDSFEVWAEVIGGILDVCDQPGFLGNLNELTTRDDHALGWSALVAEWWGQYQSNLVSIDNLHEIIVRNAELEVAFSGTLGQGLDRSQKRKLGEELRRVEGRVFGSWRVEIVVGCTVRGYPFYQLLPLACAGARERAGAKSNHTPSRAASRRRARESRTPALARPGSDTTRASGPTRPSPTTDRPLPRRAHARAGRRRREPAPGRGLRGTEHAALLGARRPRHGPPGR